MKFKVPSDNDDESRLGSAGEFCALHDVEADLA